MKEKVLGVLQLLLTAFMCATVGTPQATFSSIQHFMLNEHIYEDRCTVSNFSGSNLPVYCLESRTAYVNMYNAAELGFAIALAPAYYSTQYFGFSFTNICCCFVLAAGSVIISDRPEEQWLDDRFSYGFAILSMSAPFAIFNAFKVISNVTIERYSRLFLIGIFISLLHLGPLVTIAFSQQLAEDKRIIEVLFKWFLWVPCIWLVCTLLLMLLSDSQMDFRIDMLLQQLNSHFSLSGKHTTGILPEEPNSDITEYNNPSSYMRTIFSLQFFIIVLVYFANSLPLDLMYVGGEARATYHEELSVWKELTAMSPLIAFVAFQLFFWMTSSIGVRSFSAFTCVFAILQTLAQYWSVRTSWLISSLLVGSCQAAVTWTTVLCFIKCIHSELFCVASVIFLILGNVVKFIILPKLDVSIEFDEQIMGFNPYLLILGLQIFAFGFLSIMLNRESHQERRYYLEIEARIAFDA